MTTFTTDDRVSAELEVMPAASSIVTSQVPIAFQCFKTPEHYVLEANIPEEIEYIKSLGFKRLVPLYDAPPPREWVVSVKYKELTDDDIKNCLIEWAKIEYGDEFTDPTNDEIEPIMRMARAILRKASE